MLAMGSDDGFVSLCCPSVFFVSFASSFFFGPFFSFDIHRRRRRIRLSRYQGILLGFTGYYWVLLGFALLYCFVLLTGFLIGLYCFGGCRPFSEFTELYWVLLPIAEFVFGDFRPFQRVNRVLLGFADNDRV